MILRRLYGKLRLLGATKIRSLPNSQRSLFREMGVDGLKQISWH